MPEAFLALQFADLSYTGQSSGSFQEYYHISIESVKRILPGFYLLFSAKKGTVYLVKKQKF